jgi:UDP-2-acetamido-2-deoxy-ribo-hexuluronate aminotransferase
MTANPPPPIAFIDLQAQRRRIGGRIEEAVIRVIESGAYVLGPEVREFETKLAAFSGAARCLGCANGTEAIALPLMAWDTRPGDAIFCPSFTFVATAEVVPWLGASPVFVDIDPQTYNMDPAHLEASIRAVIAEGRLRPKAVIAVDLFGQAADYRAIAAIARKYGLKLIADSAQGFGSTLDGKHPSDWADAVATSFFPAKPLGAYGDGGAILTNDEALAETLDSLRVHGKAVGRDLEGRRFDHDPKYLNMRIGMNSRLDTIQAAILLEKLAVFPWEIEARNRVAARYSERLAGAAKVPFVIEGCISTWAQYTIEIEDRDGLGARLKQEQIPSAVYYPVPLHQQVPYARYPSGPGGLPVTEAKAERVISLPMHPDLDEATQDRIIASILSFAQTGRQA